MRGRERMQSTRGGGEINVSHLSIRSLSAQLHSLRGRTAAEFCSFHGIHPFISPRPCPHFSPAPLICHFSPASLRRAHAVSLFHNLLSSCFLWRCLYKICSSEKKMIYLTPCDSIWCSISCFCFVMNGKIEWEISLQVYILFGFSSSCCFFFFSLKAERYKAWKPLGGVSTQPLTAAPERLKVKSTLPHVFVY